MAHTFVTPVGRLVQGNPFEKITTDMYGKPLTTKSNDPTQQYFIAVAFKKDDPGFDILKSIFTEAAREGFPKLFAAGDNCSARNFSWKIVDGDGIDSNGRPNDEKPGFADHWVVRFSTTFEPRCFRAGKYLPSEQLHGPNDIPRGYYVRVAGSAKANGDPSRPGIFVNFSMVELASVGDIIECGPSAEEVFGNGEPRKVEMPEAAVIPPPNHKFLMTEKAGKFSYQDFIDQGWTDEQLKAEGYIK